MDVDHPVVVHGVKDCFILRECFPIRVGEQLKVVNAFVTRSVEPETIVKTASAALGRKGNLLGRFVDRAGRS